METVSGFISSHAKKIVAIILISVAYSFARLPAMSEAEKASLISRFGFSKAKLPELAGYKQKFIRSVNPSLKRIEAWISSVGASVALNDLDRDGLPNDVCYVDTRIDEVVVAPVPGTPSRYKPFALDPSPLPFDRETMAPMGCLPGDFNEDGLTDILVYYWGRTPLLFLRNGGQNSAAPSPLSESSYTSCELVSTGERWFTNAATQADLDGDGHIDIIIGNYFEDGARILDKKASDPDHMQHSMSRAGNGGRDRILLWSNLKATAQAFTPSIPQFNDVDGALSDEVARGWTLAVGAADLDGDLLPEIYFANDFGPDRLLHNLSTPGHLSFQLLEGEKTIATPNSKVLGRDSFKGMGVDFGDLNGDGLLDIYVSNIATEYALEESHFLWLSTGQIDRMKDGLAPYVDRSEQMGLSRSNWGWDTRFGDFDNDGSLETIQATGFMKGKVNRWPELHELAMGNDQLLQNPQNWPLLQPGDDLCGRGHNPFFVRARDGRFYDLSQELGLDDNQISRGIATADVDGDGRLDFAVANQWDSSIFYHNESRAGGAFLGLHLLLPVGSQKPDLTIIDAVGPAAKPLGRAAIGATATVYLPDGRRLVSEVDGGNGHSGKRSPDLHFGLGAIAADAEIKVALRWRDSNGQLSEKTIYLKQGWHTIVLGKGGDHSNDK